jgi:tRNA modification GTPase
VALLARIEVTFEYPEDNLPDVPKDIILQNITSVIDSIELLTKSYKSDKLINKGPAIALIGRPNVGKSSLMNRLLGFKRSIINESPGTTRDLVGEILCVSGIDVLLMDTAGVTSSVNVVESEGITASLDFAHEKADEILLILNASEILHADDVNLIRAFRDANKRFTVILNKIDLPQLINESELLELIPGFLKVSALTGINVDLLSKHIEKVASSSTEILSDFIITNSRHKELLEKSALYLKDLLNNLTLPQDILTIDMRNALDCLDEITGENVSDDILTNIFNNFCVGK